MIWLLLLTGWFRTQALSSREAVCAPRPEMVFQLAHRRAVRCIVCSPDGKWVATGSTDQTIRLWEAATGNLLRTIPAADEVVSSLAFSPDSMRLVTASHNEGWNGLRSGGHVQLWDIETGRQLHQFGGETEIVVDVAFSPDGKAVAASNQATFTPMPNSPIVRLWDAETGTLLQSFFGHGQGVGMLRFSPDGGTLAGAFGVNAVAGGILLWDIKTEKEKRVLTWKETWVSAIAFSPDGKTLAAAQESYEQQKGPGGHVVLWNMETGEPGFVLPDHGWMNSLVYSPTGDRLATVHYGRRGAKQQLVTETCVWNAQSGALQRTLSTVSETGISRLAYAPDGKTLLSGGGDGAVRWLDANTLAARRAVYGQAESAMTLAFLPESDLLAMGGYGHESTLLWNFRTGRLERRLVGSGVEGWVTAVAASPDGKTLATASIVNGFIGKADPLQLWDVLTGQPQHSLKKMQTEIYTVPSAGGKGALQKIVHHPQVWTSIAFSCDGGLLYSGGVGKQEIEEGGGTGYPMNFSEGLAFWDTRTGALKQSPGGETGWVSAIAVSPDGKMLASGGHAEPILWNALTGERIRQMQGFRDFHSFPSGFQQTPLSTLAFSPDGKTLVSGGQNGAVRFWSVETGEETFQLKGHTGAVTSVAFSPDGSALASAGEDGTARLWDLPARTVRLILPHDRPVTSVAFSPEGGLLASGCRDGALRLWSRNSGKLLVTMEVFPAQDRRTPGAWIAYTPDGYYAGSADLPKFLGWRSGDRLSPAAAFEREYHRPEHIEAALQAR